MIPRFSVQKEVAVAVNGLIDLLFPPIPSCPLCGRTLSIERDVPVCESCFKRLPPIGKKRCRKCGRAGDFNRHSGHRCPGCINHPLALDVVRAYGVYDGYLGQCIKALKYRGDLGASVALGALMSWVVATDGRFGSIHFIVPVPLHVTREADRGFNQAKVLADIIGDYIAVDTIEPVIRMRETTPQNRLGYSERTTNVRGAFHVTRPELIQNRRLLLVDDVLTTGSTLNALALALRRAGAKSCVGICAAAGSLDDDFVVKGQ